MLAAKRLTLETVNFDDEAEVDAFYDQIMKAGLEKVRAESADLQARGLIASERKLLTTELPDDMRPGSGLDFGG